MRGPRLNGARAAAPVNTAARLGITRKGRDTQNEFEIVRLAIRRAAPGVDLQVAVKDGKLQIESIGALPVLDFEKGRPVAVVPVSSDKFVVAGGDHTRVAFPRDEGGTATDVVINPGPWQIVGQRIN